jgi:hypothetical protein
MSDDSQAGGGDTGERVAYQPAWWASGRDRPQWQIDGEGSEVGQPVRAGGDGPDRAGVAAARVSGAVPLPALKGLSPELCPRCSVGSGTNVGVR